MKHMIEKYISVETFITNFLFIGIVFFVFIASIMRWAGHPIAWSVELAQLLFVWVIFLGANRALREDGHIGIDFLTKKLPDKIRHIIEILILIFMLVFLLFLVRYGILLSIENFVRQIGALTISYSFITLSVPIGSIMMAITIIFKIWRKILRLMPSSN